MHTSFVRVRSLLAAILFIAVLGVRGLLAQAAGYAEGPQPGDVYKEYPIIMDRGNDWRVTDPESDHRMAQEFLPNPKIPFAVHDLANAIRAEIVIDRWGGHPGTVGQRLRINGNQWLPLPELGTVPEDASPECYMYQDNPVVTIPLEHLREGQNTIQGTSDGQTCFDFGWGQWGWYGALLRVYYSENKGHPTATITAPAPGSTLSENPVFHIDPELARYGRGIKRIDLVARYRGYDEDGDGYFTDWHEHLHYATRSHHMGSVVGPVVQDADYQIQWDTRYIPDQLNGEISVVARIQDYDGTWSVSQPVDDLSLRRKDAQVRMYACEEIPRRFWVRQGRAQKSCTVEIPGDAPLGDIEEVSLHVRTWNGYNHGDSTVTRINGHEMRIPGTNHSYAYAVHPVPGSTLQHGANTIEFESDTEHHGVELLWPGPALIVRYSR